MTMGVYLIKNKTTKALYIGSSDNVEKRLRQHQSRLKKGDHPNPRLQAAWNESGYWNFDFALAQPVEHLDQLIPVETDWVESMRSQNVALYNQDGPVIDHKPRRVTVGPSILLNTTQAAERLGIHYQTLRAWADSGKIAVVRLPGGHRRFERSVIDRFRKELGFENGKKNDDASTGTNTD